MTQTTNVYNFICYLAGILSVIESILQENVLVAVDRDVKTTVCGLQNEIISPVSIQL